MKNILYFIVPLLITCFLFAEIKRDMMLPDLTIKLIDGKKTRLSTLLEDGPILVEFWATWCAPCKSLKIVMDQLSEVYKDTTEWR